MNLIGFNNSNINRMLDSIAGKHLLPTVSLCHHCHRHIPAWRYEKNNKVYMVKSCAIHGISHHLIENDYEFYSGLYYTQDNPKYNMNGGVLIEGSDRCNLECPHCYHLPDNEVKDPSIEELIRQVLTMPLGDPDGVHRIILAGAESTLRRGLHPDIHVSVLTNGIRFNDSDFCRRSVEAGLHAANIGLNHPDYINNETVRRKQITAIENMMKEDVSIGYIGYTMVGFHELDYILNEIWTNDWTPKTFRIRLGAEIGRNATTEVSTVSDLYNAVEQWCHVREIPFNRIIEADNNIYHVMVEMGDKCLRLINWCDETNIDMEELRSGPWCNFVPDGITNFLHQVIRRDIWKNKSIPLPDAPPQRYLLARHPTKDPLDLLNLL
jgi:hypothetical protein